MRHYLSTLHKRPPQHQKRFALLTSGTFTLLIFGVWALVNFPPSSTEKPVVAESHQEINEANPFGSFTRGLASAFQAFTGQVSELKEGLEVVDFQNKYQEMKENTLETYAQ